MSKTRNFFWPAAQSSQLLEFVAREIRKELFRNLHQSANVLGSPTPQPQAGFARLAVSVTAAAEAVAPYSVAVVNRLRVTQWSEIQSTPNSVPHPVFG